jgi:hypothetical protein
MFVFLNNVSIDQLETDRSALNLLLLGCTFAVCIGVFFERDVCPENVKK